MPRIPFILAVALCIAIPARAWGSPEFEPEPGGLTADEVAARARQNSFDVRAQREELRAAAADLDAARFAFLPRLTTTTTVMRLSQEESSTELPIQIPQFQNQLSTELNLTVPLTDYWSRIAPAHEAAQHGATAARLGLDAARLEVASAARLAYYGWVRAHWQGIVADEAVEQARSHLADARARQEVGTASIADVLRVESQLASAELLSRRAHNLERILEDQVRILTRTPSSRRIAIGEDVRADLPEMPASANPERLWQKALDRRLELQALRHRALALRGQEATARAGAMPRLAAFAGLTFANPAPRTFPQEDELGSAWQVGLQASWTPSDVLGSLASSRAAGARADAADAERAARTDAVRTEVVRAFHEVRDAEAAVTSTGRGQRAAEESYRVRRELFRAGRSTSVELTDAETELTRARLDGVDARIDLRIAHARLRHATGEDRPAPR